MRKDILIYLLFILGLMLVAKYARSGDEVLRAYLYLHGHGAPSIQESEHPQLPYIILSTQSSHLQSPLSDIVLILPFSYGISHIGQPLLRAPLYTGYGNYLFPSSLIYDPLNLVPIPIQFGISPTSP